MSLTYVRTNRPLRHLFGRRPVAVESTPILRSHGRTRLALPAPCFVGFLAARHFARRAIAGNPHPNADLARSPATGKLPLATALSPTLRPPARVRHPYRARSLRENHSRLIIPHSELSIERLSSKASTPSRSDPPSPKGRRKSTIPNSGSWNHEFIRRRGGFENPSPPLPANVATSWLSSRPGSNPWRPSRGTGYG